MTSIIETGVDKLVELINKKGRISAQDASKELGVNNIVTMEWADYLEEDGIIGIEYQFTKPYLVSKKFSKTEIKAKAKEFSEKKKGFVKKAEVSLSLLNKETSNLNNVKKEFDIIKKDLGFDIDNIKSELEDMEKYEHLKIDLDKQIEDQKSSSLEKINTLSNKFEMEKKKYKDVLIEIKKEKENLEIEKIQAQSLEESEKQILQKMKSLGDFIDKVKESVHEEEEKVLISEKNIKKLENMADELIARVEIEKKTVESMIQESNDQEQKIRELQESIIKKIMEKEQKLSGVKNVSDRIRNLFNEKMTVINFIEKINSDRNELEKDLLGLIKKAKSLQLSSNSSDLKKEIENIENTFNEFDIKKGLFENQLKKLSSFFK